MASQQRICANVDQNRQLHKKAVVSQNEISAVVIGGTKRTEAKVNLTPHCILSLFKGKTKFGLHN